MAEELNRRNFLKTAALAAGPAIISARGANDKVNIGWIGVGTRGYASLDWMHTAEPNNVQITAICDTYQGYIARGVDRMQTVWGTKPATYTDYSDLLADKNIDAVFIMTPEHLHHDMAIAALRAGKHVYVEKPLAHTIEEGWDIVKEWEKSGKICQVGHAEPQLLALQEGEGTGPAGHDRRRAFRARLLVPQRTAERAVLALRRFPPRPSRRTPTGSGSSGTAPKHDWDPHRYFQWRLYWDYSGGISTDLLVHQTDIVNFMLDKTMPKTAWRRAAIYRWTDKSDDRDVPDTFSAIYDYRQAAGQLQLLSRQRVLRIRRGALRQRRHHPGDEPAGSVLRAGDLQLAARQCGEPRAGADQVRARPSTSTACRSSRNRDGAINHFKNFIEAIRGNEKPIAPPPVGQQAAITGHMATLSFKNQKKVVWDDGAKKYHFV